MRDWWNGFKNLIQTLCCLQKTHFRFRDTNRLKEWEKTFHANSDQES